MFVANAVRIVKKVETIGNTQAASALFHFDNSFVDSVNNLTLSQYGTTANTFTSSSPTPKFGTHCLYSTGQGGLKVNTDVVNFGTGDFTIDCWAYQTTRPSYAYWFTVGDVRAGINGSTYTFIQKNTAATSRTGAITPLNQWYHIALGRQGTTYTLWIDGVVFVNSTSYLNGYGITNGDLYVAHGGSSGYAWQGWLDEFRVTKGLCRWAPNINFTPPTTSAA